MVQKPQSQFKHTSVKANTRCVGLNRNSDRGMPYETIYGASMIRFIPLLIVLCTALAACSPAPAPVHLGPDGKPLPKLYRISPSDAGRIEYNVLDSVNALRYAAGRNSLTLNAQLNAAAATHSRDMSIQNRPWHFGSDGSSPIDRVRRVGYQNHLVGELISETYETELETLAAWAEDPVTRTVLMSREATEMGFAWHQEANGKIWWTMVLGAPANYTDVR